MPFALPQGDASYADWQRACETLNVVTFEPAKMAAGFAGLRLEASGKAECMPLFAEDFPEAPADVVIAALKAREGIYLDALSDGFDMKDDEQMFASLARRPLTPEDFNVSPEIVSSQA